MGERFIYAIVTDYDEVNKVCYSIIDTFQEIKKDDYIPINEYSESYLNMLYSNGEWIGYPQETT